MLIVGQGRGCCCGEDIWQAGDEWVGLVKFSCQNDCVEVRGGSYSSGRTVPCYTFVLPHHSVSFSSTLSVTESV